MKEVQPFYLEPLNCRSVSVLRVIQWIKKEQKPAQFEKFFLSNNGKKTRLPKFFLSLNIA